ncbi:helix-turn-helix transcriptional regulator [Actinomadura fulvescens]|uniref:HTH cro/C1-type domain-containing protein n=2 Tax=Actinomadura fulvescens TaxID=46160 RepID=A0ABN3QJY5_9ACTN
MSDQQPTTPKPPPPWAIRLRAERESRGWGRREMARQLLTTISAPHEERRIRSLTRQLRQWELGVNFPRDWSAWIAQALDIDEGELFGVTRTQPSFGTMMCRHMAQRGIRFTGLARDLGYDVGELAKISHDITPPPPELAERLDALLGANGELAALAPAELPSSYRSDLPAVSVEQRTPIEEWEDDVERRAALQLLAALGTGAAVSPGTLGEALQRLMDLTMTAAPRDLDAWHLACDDHLHALRTRPPVQARQDLVIDLVSLGRQIETADAADLTELQRVKAALATLHANVLTRLGDHGAAIRWWRTAKDAADATGDLELQLGIRSTEAGYARYGQRSPTTVLRLTQDAQRIAGDKPSLGRALVVCSDAKALSTVGRHSDAKQTLRASEDLFAAAGTPCDIMPGYWNGGQPQYAELVVFAAAGDTDKVDAALGEARAVFDRNTDHLYAALIRLQGALCTVVNGGTDQGMRQAATVLDSLPASHRSHIITETGNTVVRAVPRDQRQRPAVREFRELLAKTAPKPALTAAT